MRGAVGGLVLGAQGEAARRRPLADGNGVVGDGDGRRLRLLAEDERRLAAADQLDIDLGEKLGIEQGAVQRAARGVDLVARQQRVERGGAAGMLAAGEHQRVDHPLVGDRRAAEAVELGIDEAHVEAGVVGDQIAFFEEGDEFLGDLGEARLVLEEGVVEAVHAGGLDRHRPLRVEIGVEVPARRDVVDELDGADLDDAVAVERRRARWFLCRRRFRA